MKRILIIIASIIVVLGIGIAIYYFFFANGSAHLTTGTGFPSGSDATSANLPATGVAQPAGTEVAPRLVKITSGPVAYGEVGLTIPAVEGTTGTSTVSLGTTTEEVASTTPGTPADVEVRYIDRASGNIYAYRAIARTSTRLSNKTLPGIQEASWTGDGTLALARFVTTANGADHINTYALPSNGQGGYFLEQDLDEARLAASSTLFTLLSNSSGSIGTIARSDGSGAQTLFSSALSSLIVEALGSSFIATTKASATLDGYAFLVNRSTGSFSRLLGPYSGLTTLASPSGKYLLFSYMDAGRMNSEVYTVSTGSAVNLPLATIAEKCAWTSDELSLYCAIPTSYPGTLPDDWYQGAVSFSDRIWKIDLSARLASLVLDPNATAKTSIDAVSLTLDPDTRELFFVNRDDGSLWAFGL